MNCICIDIPKLYHSWLVRNTKDSNSFPTIHPTSYLALHDLVPVVPDSAT